MEVSNTKKNKICSYDNCLFHEGSKDTSFWACAACVITSYSSKQSQRSDCHRHKTLCLGFLPFTNTANELTIQQNIALNGINLLLPYIEDDYYKHQPEVMLHHCFIKWGLMATQSMVFTNLPMLTLEDDNNDENNQVRKGIEPRTI